MTDLMSKLNTPKPAQEPATEQPGTPGASNLEGLDNLMDTESQVRRNTKDMPPSDRSWFDNKLKEIDATYKGKEEDIGKQRAIEIIGHAMAQFFAAREGSRRGIDMAGLKFHKTNWDKKLDRLLARQKEEIGAAKEVFKQGRQEKRDIFKADVQEKKRHIQS